MKNSDKIFDILQSLANEIINLQKKINAIPKHLLDQDDEVEIKRLLALGDFYLNSLLELSYIVFTENPVLIFKEFSSKHNEPTIALIEEIKYFITLTSEQITY
jgi:hypothetical protein